MKALNNITSYMHKIAVTYRTVMYQTLPTVTSAAKLDSNGLTKTKNWSGRNEVIETSGRLHPLWPQNKRLHTPRTTDYRHTRQDRWIQMELAFTVAKNATKPNPFEIIPLQTTRKENNWKTEEALARAVVTLETERIKESNLRCLWWWWVREWSVLNGFLFGEISCIRRGVNRVYRPTVLLIQRVLVDVQTATKTSSVSSRVFLSVFSKMYEYLQWNW